MLITRKFLAMTRIHFEVMSAFVMQLNIDYFHESSREKDS